MKKKRRNNLLPIGTELRRMMMMKGEREIILLRATLSNCVPVSIVICHGDCIYHYTSFSYFLNIKATKLQFVLPMWLL